MVGKGGRVAKIGKWVTMDNGLGWQGRLGRCDG